MKLFKKSLIFTIFTASVSFSHAEVESWYSYWALGFSSHSYPEEIQEVVDDIPTHVTRTQVAVDMLGFYWPLSNGMMM